MGRDRTCGPCAREGVEGNVVDELQAKIEGAARAVREADALLVAAGAGMGVDSGLPDFRGTEGFWKAYPPFAKLGLRFEQLANPQWFDRDPHLAWGFYGHRLNLYRRTVPHRGYELLLRWGKAKPAGCFVFTSNVDGQFQRAGFDVDRVFECHGSIHHLQCPRPCSGDVWPGDRVEVTVDEATMRATDVLPQCPHCHGVARPNILMFGDARWLESRAELQFEAYRNWLKGVREARLAVVECGAGTAVPSVRNECERVTQTDGVLIRINVREPHVRSGSHVGLSLGAAESLSRIDACLATAGRGADPAP
jgi:NAD-dependent SIR2 family protein deacetylase